MEANAKNNEAQVHVAVLGMGRMGPAIATRLLDGGHKVSVWNRSKGKAPDVVSAGAREADTTARAAQGADVVVTVLATDDAVGAVVLPLGAVVQMRYDEASRSGFGHADVAAVAQLRHSFRYRHLGGT